MLVYETAAPRMVLRRGHDSAPAAGGGHGGGSPAPSPAGAAGPELKEAQMFLSDYKTEDGLALPRLITIKVQDGPTEEWKVQKIKLNPTFSADHFKKH